MTQQVDAGRTGRNLPVAVGVGVFLGALVIVSLYAVKEIFIAVILIFLGLAIWELSRAVAARGIGVPLVPLLAGGAAMIVGAYWGGPVSMVGVMGLTFLAILAWRMRGGIDGYFQDISASVLVLAWAPLLAGFVALLLAHEDGADRIVTWIAVTIASDIGGYFAGIALGRHKMTPEISPKKTWEGLAGSALACVVCGGALMPWLLGGEIWQGAVIGLVVVVVATMGDLAASMIKRDLGIKDMGHLLPGHGGVMDRLDSLLATVVPVWALLALFG